MPRRPKLKGACVLLVDCSVALCASADCPCFADTLHPLITSVCSAGRRRELGVLGFGQHAGVQGHRGTGASGTALFRGLFGRAARDARGGPRRFGPSSRDAQNTSSGRRSESGLGWVNVSCVISMYAKARHGVAAAAAAMGCCIRLSSMISTRAYCSTRSCKKLIRAFCVPSSVYDSILCDWL